MSLRATLSILSLSLLAGCVSSGALDPLASRQGRAQAGQAYVQLGLGYLQQGMTQRAKIPLGQALALDPGNADAHAALALVLQAQGEPEAAEGHFLKALAQRPDDPKIRNNYGSFLYARGDFLQAEQMFRQAAADTLYPERSQVHGNLGATLLKLGRRQEAREQLERALALDPYQPRALLGLAQWHFEDGQPALASTFHQRFHQVAEPDARSLLLGSRLARALGDRSDLAEQGQHLQRLYPGTPEYQQYLSEQR
ncbi:type IV pilus biogenesis/stability protein PilW [Pseudomonas fulva]|nr:type IV pilus biogenesis/stability protein PilW [Pseudomonas fulva]MBF8781861.1 type IV pilus biogenesis/stability protein PilW [Pseudomonas fulva]